MGGRRVKYQPKKQKSARKSSLVSETDSKEAEPADQLHETSLGPTVPEIRSAPSLEFQGLEVKPDSEDDHSEASHVTDMSGMDAEEPHPALPLRKTSSGKPKYTPRRRASPGATHVPLPRRRIQRKVPDSALLTPVSDKSGVLTSSEHSVSKNSPTSVISAVSPQPPVRKPSPRPKKHHAKQGQAKAAGREAPELEKKTKRKLTKKRSTEPRKPDLGVVDKPPRVPRKVSKKKSKQLKVSQKHNDEPGEAPAMATDLSVGGSSKASSGTSSYGSNRGVVWSGAESKSGSCDTASNEEGSVNLCESRVVSSVAIWSNTAPRAPGEGTSTGSDDSLWRRGSSSEEQKVEMSHKGASTVTSESDLNRTQDGQTRNDHVIQEVPTQDGQNRNDHVIQDVPTEYDTMPDTGPPLPGRMPSLSSSSESSPTTDTSQGTRYETLASMATIPEVEASSIPAPDERSRQLLEEAGIRPWRFSRVLRSFVSPIPNRSSSGARNGHNQDIEIATANDSPQHGQRILSARWSLVLPSRRLESSIVPVSVKTEDEELSVGQQKMFRCLALMCLILVAASVLLVILIFPIESDDPNMAGSNIPAVPDPTEPPGNWTMAPTQPKSLPPKPTYTGKDKMEGGWV